MLPQSQFKFFLHSVRVYIIGRSARIAAPCAAAQRDFYFLLETFATQCVVAVGGAAYLAHHFFVEVYFE